jgi:hypothetical protein
MERRKGSWRLFQLMMAAIVVILMAACSSSNDSSGSPDPAAASSVAAKVSAEATSTAATDAKQFFAACLPAGAAGQVKLVVSLTTVAGWKSLMGKCGVPEADDQAAATCALGRVEAAGKPPKEGKLDWLLNAAFPCVKGYQGGGTGPAATTSPSAAPTPSASAK